MTIINAAPKSIKLGAEDKSSSSVSPQAIPTPQHLPLSYIFAQRGPIKRTVVGANEALTLYGEDSFDKDKKWYNHSTRFLAEGLGVPNAHMVKRLVPDDAGIRANVTVWVDVIAKPIPNYVRNEYGSLVLEPGTNDYKVDPNEPTVDGYEIKFIREYNLVDEPQAPGLLKPKTGSMTYQPDPDPAEPDVLPPLVTSMMYPLFEVRAAYQGEYYNNIGFAIDSIPQSEIDSTILSELKALPFRLSLFTRPDNMSSAEILKSLYAEHSVNFSFVEKAVNPKTKARFDFEQVFVSNWFNEGNPLLPLRYNDYEYLYFYRPYYETVLKKLAKSEAPFIGETKVWEGSTEANDNFSWYDLPSANLSEEEIVAKYFGMFNMFTARSSSGVKYRTIVRSDEVTVVDPDNQKVIEMAATNPIWLGGGSDGSVRNPDGTFNEELFEKLVIADMKKYADSDSEYMDTAINVESIFYDSGYSLDAKTELANFITLRKDTVLVLSTWSDNYKTKILPLSEQRAIAVALGTRLKLAPESEYFGTGCCRAVIVAGTGKLTDGTEERIPLTYDLMRKSAKMMGKSSGVWSRSDMFDVYPGNAITSLVDIEPAHIPNGIKPTLWNDGIVWPQPYDRVSYHTPALQTVYSNDTSVLNGYWAVMALAQLNKIADRVWRKWTGSTTMTDAEFVSAVENDANEMSKNIFGGVVEVTASISIEDLDKQRGYSWRMIHKLYGGVLKTVMTHNTEVYRWEQLNS